MRPSGLTRLTARSSWPTCTSVSTSSSNGSTPKAPEACYWSTEWAPWYVVPAARNWVKALAVAQLLVAALERMDPQLPPPQPGIENVIVE